MNNDQDKSFEKRLNSLSNDFELKPAADSWNKIEAQLPEKKKRKFIFLLFPVGIAMLLAGVFIIGGKDKSFKKSVVVNAVFTDVNGLAKGLLIAERLDGVCDGCRH